MPSLLVSLADDTEVTHELTEAVITLGRVSDNTIHIEDASVSSHHAELILRGTDYVLKDLGSTNGTRVNGRALDPEAETALHPDDQILFGSIATRYVTEAGTHPQPLPAGAEMISEPGSSTAAPSNFANASPFQKKTVKKDPANVAVLALGVVALLGTAFAIFTVLNLKSPL